MTPPTHHRNRNTPITAPIFQVCHCEEQSDVAISSTRVSATNAPIDIVHFRFSMLIGVYKVCTALLEIPTARWASE